MDIPINEIHIETRLRPLDDSKVINLMSSIKEIGVLLQPIVIRPNGHGYKLVAGMHRLEAFKRLGRKAIPANVVQFDDLEAELAEIDENLKRNELTQLEQSEHFARRDELLDEIGQRAKSGFSGNQYTKVGGDKLSPPTTTTAKIAESVGVSERSYQRKKSIATKIKPEVRDKIRNTKTANNQSDLQRLADMDEATQNKVADKLVSGAAKTVTEAGRQVTHEDLPDVPVPTGKYRVIYADPPWQYGNTQPDYQTEQRDHYRTMTMKEICAMPVVDIAEDNAVMFLWVTSPILEEAFDVIHAWGFKYKSSFVWDKVKHNMGHYNSVRHEFLLICVRGSCQPDIHKLFDSVVTEERTEHSVKPESFRQIIDTIYPKGNRIELFARKRIEGWDVYGNQAN